ncbi:high mobility group B protein 15-like [Vigna radiata var. radiata]|uniref:High mobility group B protein 15-like n=1 Tax=Vigna radiata var. radiata TaxID=3916 RepID=A0A1S3V1G1_VIGRR|nr:high mobility group B protein 15-like [Vigna radiata var. radiata]
MAACSVIGVIDGKFESGYIVTVRMGSEILKGILYEVPQQTPLPTSHRRKKSDTKKRVLVHPKHSRSGYNFFYAEQHATLKPLHHGKEGDIPRMIAQLWSKLKLSQKMIYQEMAMKDKERYMEEMEDYLEKLKMDAVITDAVPLRQWPPKQDTDMLDEVETNKGNSSGEDLEDDYKAADRGFDMNSMLPIGMEIETNYLGSKENSIEEGL